MLDAGTDFLVEEAKLRGAIPTCRAVLNPVTDNLEIPASQIINPGSLTAAIPRNFQNISLASYRLLVDNRAAQWLRSVTASPGKITDTLRLDHGFQLSDGSKTWLPIYTGAIKQVGGMHHEIGKAHNVIFECENPILKGLKTKIGVPAADGTRQPYMHGPYMVNCELKEVTDSYLGTIVKTGTGSAQMCILDGDKYSNTENLNFRIQVESTGDIGITTFKYSIDDGMTWEKAGIFTNNIISPIRLVHNLKVYFIGGPGNDFVVNDYWSFTAYAKVNHFQIPGYPFEAITTVFKNGEEIADNLTITPSTGDILDTGNTGGLKARVIKDYLMHPVDIIQDILITVGLTDYVHTLSFAQAKNDTLEYAIGVRFENVPAEKAISLITANCLFFFWEDFGLLHLQAYTGSL